MYAFTGKHPKELTITRNIYLLAFSFERVNNGPKYTFPIDDWPQIMN